MLGLGSVAIVSVYVANTRHSTLFQMRCYQLLTYLCHSLLRRGSRVCYINPLCEVYRRRKVEWIDQAENLCQMCVDFSYILVVFSYIDGFLDFG